MAIVVQGEGLLAILSTDCLGSKSAAVPSQGGGGQAQPLAFSPIRPPGPAWPAAPPVKDRYWSPISLVRGAAALEVVPLRAGGAGAAAFFLPFSV